MKILILVVLFFGLVSCPIAGADPISIWKPAAIHCSFAAGDALSTLHAKSYAASAGLSFVELNPRLQSTSSLLAWKAGQCVALTSIDVALQKGGHRGKAKLLRWLVAGVGTGLIINNEIQARTSRRP